MSKSGLKLLMYVQGKTSIFDNIYKIKNASFSLYINNSTHIFKSLTYFYQVIILLNKLNFTKPLFNLNRIVIIIVKCNLCFFIVDFINNETKILLGKRSKQYIFIY